MDFLDSLADIINDDLGNIDIFDDELMHYGTPRHSGRYPWGSGENPINIVAISLVVSENLKKRA